MKKHKITQKEYAWECGDACCDEYGLEWYVDDEFVHRSPCEDNGWMAVLAHLGIEIELIHQDKDGDNIWSL